MAKPLITANSPKEKIAEFKKKNACFFWKPYEWQQTWIEACHRKTIIAAIASNKIGKSAGGVNIVGSWCLGYEPWTKLKEGDPGAVCVEGAYFRESSLGIKPPVNIIVTGEDWKLHIGKTIVPEMKKWFPEGWYTTRKNEQGVDFFFQWHNGSTITLMSYTQDDDLFESFRIQGVMMDEPPPKTKYTAMSRGLLLDNGKTLLSLTPLKEAWILDEIVLSGRKDVAIVDNLKITDNPDLYNSDYAVLKGMGLSDGKINRYFDLLLYEDKEKGKPVTDKGYSAEKYLEEVGAADKLEDIQKLKILKFIKDIDPSDVPPRVFGMFKSLVGRVLKEWDTNIHLIKPFVLPTDWPVVPLIDFHLSTPQAIGYYAVDKRGIDYCVGETWSNLDGDGVSDDIIRKKITQGWNITDAYIDPLSKGDLAYVRNRLGTDLKDTFSIIEERLSEHGITLHVASKDKESGIKNLQTALKGVNGMPTYYVFENCERHIYEYQRWVFDDNGKPSKDGSDHFCENSYRYFLVGNNYEAHKVNPLPQSPIRNAPGMWMSL